MLRLATCERGRWGGPGPTAPGLAGPVAVAGAECSGRCPTRHTAHIALPMRPGEAALLHLSVQYSRTQNSHALCPACCELMYHESMLGVGLTDATSTTV